MSTSEALTPEQIQLIKATVPVLAEHGNHITDVFYVNLLKEQPALNNVFNISNQRNRKQPRALAAALHAYAANIDNLIALSGAVELICNKHASLRVQPDAYDVVAKYLFEAMGIVLGGALTPEIAAAWTAAYWQLANMMIARESQIYQQNNGAPDWRDFKISEKMKESNEITSFYFAPVDGEPLPTFRSGQYISLRVHVPELDIMQPRQYTLSDKPCPDHYRISVKKEVDLHGSESSTNAHPGIVSNLLHDTFEEGDLVQLSVPCGDFWLGSTGEPASPVVLISAGVGMTPFVSMLESLVSAPATMRKIHFIHSARNQEARAFKDRLRALDRDYHSLQVTLFDSRASTAGGVDQASGDHVYTGRIDLSKLDGELFLDDSRAEYYICGPAQFMEDMKISLQARGVGEERIKMELFGPSALTD